MPSRQQWSGRDIVITGDGLPFRGLSEADDAVTVEYIEPLYHDSVVDRNGDNGVHVENPKRKLRIQLKFMVGATADLARMHAQIELRKPFVTFNGRNLGSSTSAFTASNVAIKTVGQWSGSNKPMEVTFELEATKGQIIHGGQRVYGV
jgi:hypothetical protein